MTTLRRMNEMSVSRQPGSIKVDLCDVRWVDPLHLVFTAALAHQAYNDGLNFTLTGLDEAQTSYVARMHLHAVLDEFDFPHDLHARGRERDRSDSLHEVHMIRTPSDVVDLANLVHERVAPQDADVASALHKGIAELGANVCEHSQAGVGFVAAQTVEGTAQMRFAVADAGVGLLATLSAQGARDDQSALLMALNGASGAGLAGHGTGIRSTVGAVTDLNGDAVLASGSQLSLVTRQGRRPLNVAEPFPGTLFEGRLPLSAGRHRRSAG